MNIEKKRLIKKIHAQLNKKKESILNLLPSTHLIEDGIIIRFFTYWENCEDDARIRFKKIINNDNPDENIIFFFIPKGTYFDLRHRFYIDHVICLSGKIKLNYDNNFTTVEKYSKININSHNVQGTAVENSYLITTTN